LNDDSANSGSLKVSTSKKTVFSKPAFKVKVMSGSSSTIRTPRGRKCIKCNGRISIRRRP
ncbi:MAG: hypothetical protein QOK80_11505, partial [Nitrososphaeraceae archaeon]|nr:hypothetical protein [Nitrososphaeraceae archaeon]